MDLHDLYKAICRLEAKIEEQTLLKKDILTLKEAAKFLDISTSALYKLTSSSGIAFTRPAGKRIYFNRSDLEKWLSQNKNDSTDDTDRKANNYLIKHTKPTL